MNSKLPMEAAGLLLCAGLALLPGCATTHSAAARSAGGCLEARHEPWPASENPATAPGEQARVRKSPQSDYPLVAKQMGVQGTVTVSALVCEHGRVVRARVKDSIPALDDAAVETVKHWTFKPAKDGGKAVSCWVDIPVKFSL